MNRVDASIEALIEAVIESEEHRQYQEIREKLKAEPERERRVSQYRHRMFQLQNECGDKDRFEDLERLEQEYSSLLQEPLVEEYLAAELSICRMVQRINGRLMAAIDFEPAKEDGSL